MLMPRVMPCLLKKGPSLVKTIKFNDPKYIGDPVNTIQIYNNLEVDELIFLDIEATNNRAPPPFELVSKITTECFMPLTYGGGIRNTEDMKMLFSLGVEKIVICSYAHESPNIIQEASNLFGSQSVIVAIDVKINSNGNYEVWTNSGSKNTGIDPVEYAVRMEKFGAGEIFLNSIDRDGTMEGYDIKLIKEVSSSLNIPLIASGGAGDESDFVKAIKDGGASAVAAGSLFVFQGKNRSVLINYPSREELEEMLRE